ncbi:hypothetical protein JA1_004669 [Spathaspora sp. JA1]|nr:hypothetical protein JA1_004669 [Spathaspora sp. JA1]
MLPPPSTASTASYAYQPANTGGNPGAPNQTPNVNSNVASNNIARGSSTPGAVNANTANISGGPNTNSPISGTGASSNPPPTNTQLTSKFNGHDIQVLRQLLVAGEKHKWKQITKEINQTSNNNAATAAAAAASNPQQQGYYRNPASGPGGAGGGASARSQGQIAPKNVSPTFVMKQYQSLLGLPNNSLYFGTLGSSLPYVVAPNGWDDIGEQHYQHHFGDDIE